MVPNYSWYSVRFDYIGKRWHSYYKDMSIQSVKSRLRGAKPYATNISIKRLKGEPPPYVMRYIRGNKIELD